MDKKDYLQFCRYYKGEEKSPYKNDMQSLLWDYERIWIDLSLKKDDYLGKMLDDYLEAELQDFEKADDTPATLKALLYNRYEHWMQGDTDGFKQWYKKTYIA